MYSIYKIYSVDTTKIYVGSTSDTLENRLKQHIYKFNRYCKGNKEDYISSIKIIHLGNAKIELIELCETYEDARKKEGQYILKNKVCCVNYKVEKRTKKEYYEQNKEHLDKKKKDNYEKNKEIILKKQKEYVEANREKTNAYQKEYRDSHKEQMSEYKKKHYKEKDGVDVMCECGNTFKKKHEKRHKASKKHNDIINGVVKETAEERKAKYNANRRAKYALKNQ